MVDTLVSGTSAPKRHAGSSPVFGIIYFKKLK